jgi:hypothetical protein
LTSAPVQLGANFVERVVLKIESPPDVDGASALNTHRVSSAMEVLSAMPAIESELDVLALSDNLPDVLLVMEGFSDMKIALESLQ